MIKYIFLSQNLNRLFIFFYLQISYTAPAVVINDILSLSMTFFATVSPFFDLTIKFFASGYFITHSLPELEVSSAVTRTPFFHSASISKFPLAFNPSNVPFAQSSGMAAILYNRLDFEATSPQYPKLLQNFHLSGKADAYRTNSDKLLRY